MHGCVPMSLRRERTAAPLAVPSSLIACPEVDVGLALARLRLDLLRLARQLADRSTADEIVQDVFLHVVRRGPAAPRDSRGIPRPAYLASLVHAFAAERATGAAHPELVSPSLQSSQGNRPCPLTGARGG